MSVRLYWQHDLDLLALHESPGLPSFSIICKEALSAYVRNTPYKIFVPDKVYFTKYVDSKSFTLFLNPKTEQDLIDFLNSVEYGFRCNVLKQIVRGYMNHSFIAPYFAKSTIKVKSRVHRNKEKTKNNKSSSKTNDKKSNSPSTKVTVSEKKSEMSVQKKSKEKSKQETNDTSFDNSSDFSKEIIKEEISDPLAEFLVDEEPLEEDETPAEDDKTTTDFSEEKGSSSFQFFGEMAKLMNN